MGKGGTGKTTITALFLKYVLASGIKPVLVIDADPNSCLGELLDINTDLTIGSIKEELLNLKDTTISKHDHCEYALNNALIENPGFDLITMGRSEGPGCYCYVNNIIKTMIAKLEKNYKLIIVDCEAGLEHLSRQTLGNIDTGFIVSDLSRKGILTGIRQVDLMQELDIKTRNNYLLINNISDIRRLDSFQDLINSIDDNKLQYAGAVSNDKNVLEFELNQMSLLELPDNSESYLDLKNIFDKKNLSKQL